ncbi:MAG: hypothetical protein ACI8X3_001870 [Saprospiraceae bacterium]|jgi:hypothetical protein
MKIKNLQIFVLFLFCTLGFNQTKAQLVQEVSITAEEANFQMIVPNSYLLEIGTANGYYFKEEIAYTNNISIGNIRADGEQFPDGAYTMQVTPIVKLSDTERLELQGLRADNDPQKIAAFRMEHNLPDLVNVYNINFSIRNGQFVTPDQKETKGVKLPTMSGVWQQDHPALYASLTNVELDYGKPMTTNSIMPATDNTAEDDQVFLDDVIVGGSICVGQDCNNGESFGFDTGRYKENNLRVHFDDTSNSSSFPKNDWRIAINDSSNGGASYFAVEDATAGTTPFRVLAGAGNNALYVSSSGGNVGMGTASPVVELQITDGDSPTMRLEQNGSSGFGQQTWDVAGNETNFFIRDATNGSTLPFRILPGAPSNSIYTAASGNIGLGTANPGHKLQVESGNVYVKAGNLGVNVEPTVALDVLGNFKVKGASVFSGDASYLLASGATYYGPTFSTILKVDAVNTRVGIGTGTPGHLLELGQDDAAKPNGGSWTAASDRRLKTNIVDFNEGLDAILKIHPVSYNYNGKLGYPTEKTFIGVIAQEMREIAPYTVKKLNKPAPEGEEDYLAFDGTPVTYLLINAVQEQQEMINAQKAEIERLKTELAEVQGLKAQMAALAEMVSSLNQTTSSKELEVEVTEEKE